MKSDYKQVDVRVILTEIEALARAGEFSMDRKLTMDEAYTLKVIYKYPVIGNKEICRIKWDNKSLRNNPLWRHLNKKKTI